MKIFYKIAFIAFVLLLVLTSHNAFSQEQSNIITTISASNKYKKMAQKAIDNHKWINFDVTVQGEYHGETLPDCFFNISYYNDGNTSGKQYFKFFNKCYMIDEKSVTYVDDENREFAVFNKNKDNNWYELVRSNVEDRIKYMPYYGNSTLKPLLGSRHVIQHYSEDTTIDCRQYVKFHGHSLRYNQQNPETKSFDIPSQFYCYTWVDKETNIIDSVNYWQLYENECGSEHVTYVIKNLDFEDKTDCYYRIFDKNNPKYKCYSWHDERNPPFSMTGTSNMELSDSVLSYPLIGLSGDTITLGDFNGWILIDFWAFGCIPCYSHMETMRHEKDSLGYLVLEDANVKLLSINPISDNHELIKKVADNYNLANHFYSGKGINTLINVSVFPTYYLISPDSKIVWRSNSLGDYSEIFNKINGKIE